MGAFPRLRAGFATQVGAVASQIGVVSQLSVGGTGA